ncbi:MAG: thioredoxin family protein [Candidatus Thorarchaeota archaeon]|nr:thioredoxin family protein [Candidatus Thorarchaeota archaeon]
MVVEMDDATREQVKEMFENLVDEVTIHLFTEGNKCLYCNDTRDMVEMVAELSDLVKVVEHEGSLDNDVAKKMGVKHHPAIVLHGKDEYKVKFYGIPAGHEFAALIGGIIDVSSGTAPLPPDVIEDIRAIDKPIHIRVFVTPQCPYCPGMTRLAHQAAILNPLIDSEMFESLEFQDEASKYEVFGVPKTIFNETVSADGLTPPEMFVDKLFEAIE